MRRMAGVQVHHVIRRCQIEAGAAGPQADQKQIRPAGLERRHPLRGRVPASTGGPQPREARCPVKSEEPATPR